MRSVAQGFGSCQIYNRIVLFAIFLQKTPSCSTNKIVGGTQWANKAEAAKMGKGAAAARKKGHVGAGTKEYKAEKSRKMLQRRPKEESLACQKPMRKSAPSFLRGNLTDFAIGHGIDESLFKAMLRKLDFSRVQFDKDIQSFGERRFPTA